MEDTLPLTRYQNINLRQSENILNRSQSLMHITLGKTQTGDSLDITLSMYRHIFNHEYNFSFHVPKKDQCNLCTKYHRSMADGSAKMN